MIHIDDLSNDKIILNGVYNYQFAPNNKILFSNSVKREGSYGISYHLFLYDITTKQLHDLGVGNNAAFSMDGDYIVCLESDYLKKDIIHIIKTSDLSVTSYFFEENDFMISQPFLSANNTIIYFSARPKKSN